MQDKKTQCLTCQKNIYGKTIEQSANSEGRFCSHFCRNFHNESFVYCQTSNLSNSNASKIVALAWSDEVPFDAIRFQYGLSESDVIKLCVEN